MLASNGGFKFQEVLPRLVVAYEAGRLVPFIGSGMSRPNCRNWPDLIELLEKEPTGDQARKVEEKVASWAPGRRATQKKQLPPDVLIRRATAATRRLRYGESGYFESALESALFDPDRGNSVPPQTAALARIWWPLVLTTNYDNYYVKAFSDQFDSGALAVVGRNPEDCQRVLMSLSTAGRALLWALQGHLGKPFSVTGHQRDREHAAQLAREIVLDHAEYRRVTHREPHFRRAFAEVFRQRSLFFLGTGLAEPYFQELFGEVLEFYGPSTRTHYALMPKGQVDPEFMYSRFQIAVVECVPSKKPPVADFLDNLAKELQRRATVPTSWSWGEALEIKHGNEVEQHICSNIPGLEITSGRLPMTQCSEKECLVVSAGGSLIKEHFYLSDRIEDTVRGWLKFKKENSLPQPKILDEGKYVGKYDGGPVFAVRARKEKEDKKDLSKIAPASEALFKSIGGRYKSIHMQLLASGGRDNEGASWSRRPFPVRFAFIEIVRAWGSWKRGHKDDKSCLRLCVVDPAVIREIASGRIDVMELLLCDDIRFWAEIVEQGILERWLFQKPPKTKLSDVVRDLGLSKSHWSVEVSPPASIEDSQSSGITVESRFNDTLKDLCIVPGGTLHFRRRGRS